jgi:hypothetical protein
MIIDTLTFSNKAEGWTSRWTYRPEWMIGLNSSFYSFKGGNLYEHDTNTTRTQFYDQPINNLYGFSISTIFNQEPTTIKMFKTLALDCTSGLNTIGATDLDQIQMSKSNYINKEGEFFSYLRRPAGQINLQLLSSQGIGTVSSAVGTTITMNSSFTNISQGDSIYEFVGSTPILVGVVQSVSGNDITVYTVFSSPSPGDYLICVKQSSVESYGARGYFMDVTLSLSGNDATPEVELFAIKSSLFKSFP